MRPGVQYDLYERCFWEGVQDNWLFVRHQTDSALPAGLRFMEDIEILSPPFTSHATAKKYIREKLNGKEPRNEYVVIVTIKE
jgi:hypothetical protein